jgi:hypothetical protein
LSPWFDLLAISFLSKKSDDVHFFVEELPRRGYRWYWVEQVCPGPGKAISKTLASGFLKGEGYRRKVGYRRLFYH